MKRIVLDLETKHSFDEVGGREHIEELEVSLVGIYDYTTNRLTAYDENQLDKVEKVLDNTDELIGFNVKNFDIPVLAPHFSGSIGENIAVVDIMDDVERALGFRVSLNNIAGASLGLSKSGHGLDAIRWYREGKLDILRKYCLDDVKITKKIYDYGKSHGYFLTNLKGFTPLFMDEPLRDEYAIPATWSKRLESRILESIVKEAVSGRCFVEIDYVSSTAHEGEDFRKKRVIEIRELNNNSIRAYCFLREAERVFRIPRILDAKIV